jgi:hypothetical protein
MNIGVIVPSRPEAPGIMGVRRHPGGGGRVEVSISGVGEHNARRAANRLLDAGVDRVRRVLVERLGRESANAVSEAPLFQATAVVDDAARKRTIATTRRVVAIDMESWAIGDQARSANVPFVALRIVVDEAAFSLPPSLAGCLTGDGRMNYPMLAWALLRAPPEIPLMFGLARRYISCRPSLARAARAIHEVNQGPN